MTNDYYEEDLATSWKRYVILNYKEILKKAFESAIKVAKDEGIADLDCLIYKVPFVIDFIDLSEFNSEFYEYFNTSNAEELKGLIRESCLEILNEIASESNTTTEIKQIDRRQISIDLKMIHLQATPDVLLEKSTDFYQAAIAHQTESKPMKLCGKIVSASKTSIFVDEIKTFLCLNPRCRNSKKLIRFEERYEDLGGLVEESNSTCSTSTKKKMKEEVFKNVYGIMKCQECREEIHKLFPFTQKTEIKLVKIQMNPSSCFKIDGIIIGNLNCEDELSVSNSDWGFTGKLYSNTFIGYPKLSFENKFNIKFTSSYYFEIYGIDTYNYENNSITPSMNLNMKQPNMMTKHTSGRGSRNQNLDLLKKLLRYQLIGSANQIHFNISLPNMDEVVLKYILKMIIQEDGFEYDDLIESGSSCNNEKKDSKWKDKGKWKSVQIKFVSKRSKLIRLKDYYGSLNQSDQCSVILNRYCEECDIIFPSVELSREETANIILNNQMSCSKAVKKEPVNYTMNTVDTHLNKNTLNQIQDGVISLRRQSKAGTSSAIPLKAAISLIAKLTRVIIISRYLNLNHQSVKVKLTGNNDCEDEDVEEAIWIYIKLSPEHHVDIIFKETERDVNVYNNTSNDVLLSPSVSFDMIKFE